MPIDLDITSTVGYRNSGYTYVGPEPIINTLIDLEGNNPSNVFLPRRFITVSSPEQFVFLSNSTSTEQTIDITNYGNVPVNIRSIKFSNRGPVAVPRFPTGWVNGSISIAPNSTASFFIAYETGSIQGEYSNSFTINSDDYRSTYTQLTSQKVNREFFYKVSPLSVLSTTTFYGTATSYRISITQFNGFTSTFNYSLAGSEGFYISTSSRRSALVVFDNSRVNDVNGYYTATLTINGLGIINQSTLTNHVNITPGAFQNYGTWLSAGSRFDAVVGMSYDLIDGIRYLTIGVGAGGNNSPAYDAGGAELLSVSSLGISGGNRLFFFPYWGTVYRIPILDTENNKPARYYSFDYLVKAARTNYGNYFGEKRGYRSQFIVDDDGYRNLTIQINHLREKPEDDQRLATTLDNLTRIFYYYSEADIGGRFYQLGSPKGNGDQTDLFIGFANNGNIRTGLVYYPK